MRHTCHWYGCRKEVPPAMWGCKDHWFALPKALRDKVWAVYVPGQEIRKDPSPAYMKVIEEVDSFVKQYIKKQREVKT